MSVFNPRDVYACTVDVKTWDLDVSMEYLFGAYCSADLFRQDKEMMEIYGARMVQGSFEHRKRNASEQGSQSSADVMSSVAAKQTAPAIRLLIR